MENRKRDIRYERLEALKNGMIDRFTINLDFDNEKKLYDQLLALLLTGDLDEDYLSSSLAGITGQEKEEIMNVARKYVSLLFYDGDIRYWSDSIDGVYLSDYDLVLMKLLDNYDFLLGLVKDAGEDVVKRLVDFEKTDLAGTSSLLDFLRNVFPSDSLLKEVLNNLLREDGPYSGLSDTQKKVLLSLPAGTFYEGQGDEIQKISPEELKHRLFESSFGTDPEEEYSYEQFGRLFSTEESFEQAVMQTVYPDCFPEIPNQK